MLASELRHSRCRCMRFCVIRTDEIEVGVGEVTGRCRHIVAEYRDRQRGPNLPPRRALLPSSDCLKICEAVVRTEYMRIE